MQLQANQGATKEGVGTHDRGATQSRAADARSRDRFSLFGALATLVAVIGSANAHAGVTGEGVTKEVAAGRTAKAPVIDGRLTDAAWQSAPTSSGFTQSFPIDGADPSVRTTIRVVYDDTTLYLGINALDPNPERIVARIARRDNTVESDSISIVLDSRHDHDTGYWFWINAAGVLADGQVSDDTRIDRNWDAVWRGRAHIHSTGWSAELAIPYSILRFPKRDVQKWGLNVTRFVTHTKESLQWVHIARTDQGNLSRAGHIAGIRGLSPKRPLELRPFAVVRAESELPTGGGAGIGADSNLSSDVSAGLDLKLGLTNNLSLDLTLFPDFGQVEADAVVLNLTTFETRFPEKRPFFLEDANVLNTDIRYFHSRRIGERPSGLDRGSLVTLEDGRSAEVTDAPLSLPIWGAARVSGKITRRFTIAVLDALTGPETLRVRAEDGERLDIEPTPIRNFAAARGKYSFGGSSYVGFIATGLTRTGSLSSAAQDHDAYGESIDARWVAADSMYRAFFHAGLSHRVGGPKFLERSSGGAPCTVSRCTQLTRADGALQSPGDIGAGGVFGGGKVGGEWTSWTMYSFRSPQFDANSVGFENDWDYHNLFVRLGRQEQKPFSVFNDGSVNMNLNGRLGFDGLVKDASAQLSASGTYKSFWRQGASITYRPAGAWTTRETSDGARFERPAGLSGRLSLSTDSRRSIVGSVAGTGGVSLTDDQWNAGVSSNLSVRVIAPLELAISGNLNMNENVWRFYDCADSLGRTCSLRSSSRDYVVADESSGALSITFRGTLALSPDLSLQAYTQVFAARGWYTDYGRIDDQTGARPRLERAETEPTEFAGDTDGDGIKDDDFSFATLNGNIVLRWEFRRGAWLTGVYTRAQDNSVSLGGERPSLSFSGLRHGRTEEAVLVKLALYYSR